MGILRKAFNYFGMDIHKTYLLQENKFKWLREFGINTVLDIGANKGQFAKAIRPFVPDAMLYSFEPLKEAYDKLQKAHDGSWTKGYGPWKIYRLALGDYSGTAKIQKAPNTTDSSILKMTDFYRGYYDGPVEMNEEEITIDTLDSFVARENLVIKPELMIKVDVEGLEKEVVHGGKNTFRMAKVIYIEVTFGKERYFGQIMFAEMYETMREMGFNCRGFYEAHFHPETGFPMWADAVFVKEESK